MGGLRAENGEETVTVLVRGRRAALAALALMIGGTTAQADWTACQSKPTRACVSEEALRGDSGPLPAKERLDVLMQAGVMLHPEYATPDDLAEALRLAQSAHDLSVVNYAMLAIRGLVATNQKQPALELVGSFTGAMQTIAIGEITRALVKAGDLDTALALPDRIQPPLDQKSVPGFRNSIAVDSAKTLADNDKIEQALALIAEQRTLPDYQLAEMQAAVGQAYAKRGDSKAAKDFFDRAENSLESARQAAVGPGPQLQLRYPSIRLQALRGDGDALKAALQQAASDTSAQDQRASYERTMGGRRVINALIETKQFQTALEVAKSLTPVTERDSVLAGIIGALAVDGRTSDARAALALMADGETPARLVALRSLAMAAAKSGDVASALQIAAQIQVPAARRATLFVIARAMPQ